MGRLGGDEFLVVGHGLDWGQQQTFIATLRETRRGIYCVGEQRINYPGASFGVAEVNAQVQDVESALRAADDAMYQEKKSRRRNAFLNID